MLRSDRTKIARAAMQARGQRTTSKLRGVTRHARTMKWEAHVSEAPQARTHEAARAGRYPPLAVLAARARPRRIVHIHACQTLPVTLLQEYTQYMRVCQ